MGDAELNPSEYDAAELRALAGVPDLGDGRPDRTDDERLHRTERSVRTAQFRRLLELRAANPSAGRPHLRGLPSSRFGEEVALDWLEYLVLAGGRTRAREALGYYREIGWLTDDVERSLVAYLPALPDPRHVRRLGAADHRLSLLYVARLAALP